MLRHPANIRYDNGDEALATGTERSDGEARGESRPEDAARELPVAPTAASEDRCAACGAPLAHDQRYCVECGERRGQSRFPTAQPTTEVRTARSRARRAAPAPRVSSGTTLVAGVGVLLLAIGLGVLIGRLGNNNQPQSRAAAPQAITIQGGGGGGGVAATTTPQTRTTVHLTRKSKAKLKAAAAASAPPPAAIQKKATQAAGKVLGNSKNLAAPTSTVGQACGGNKAGCQGGKFTGNFFGP